MKVRDFEARVSRERWVLSRVNARFLSGSPLSGLSPLAINLWCQEQPDRDNLKDVLLCLARHLKQEALSSQVTFELDAKDERDEAQALQLLEALLQGVQT